MPVCARKIHPHFSKAQNDLVIRCVPVEYTGTVQPALKRDLYCIHLWGGGCCCRRHRACRLQRLSVCLGLLAVPLLRWLWLTFQF